MIQTTFLSLPVTQSWFWQHLRNNHVENEQSLHCALARHSWNITQGYLFCHWKKIMTVKYAGGRWRPYSHLPVEADSVGRTYVPSYPWKVESPIRVPLSLNPHTYPSSAPPVIFPVVCASFSLIFWCVSILVAPVPTVYILFMAASPAYWNGLISWENDDQTSCRHKRLDSEFTEWI